jgi:hypothetical protein
MALPAVIAANALRYVVSGTARKALKKVVEDITKYYATKTKKPTADAIKERAEQILKKAVKDRNKAIPSAGKVEQMKKAGSYAQTSAKPLRLKDSGKVIPKTKTKIGSIPLKTAQQPKPGVVTKARKPKGEYGRKPQQRKKGLGQRTTIGKSKYKQREVPVTGSTPTRGGVSVAERRQALSRVSKIAAAAKRNKGKLLVGAVATGVAVSALKDKGKKKTTTTKTSSKTTTKKNTRTFDRKNFPNPKNLENYMGRRGGINVRKKKKK